MRLVSFRRRDDGPEGLAPSAVEGRLGVLIGDHRVAEVPNPNGGAWTMRGYLEAWPGSEAVARRVLDEETAEAHLLTSESLLAPVPRPTSVRDFYAFEAHVKRARLKRWMEVPPEWYQMPIF